jgi:hypothetical protein
MPLTNANIQRYFKIFGKLILLSQEGKAIALNYRKLMSSAVDQAVSGVPEEFATIQLVLNPMTTATAQLITAADGVPAAAVKYAGLMLQQVCAVDLGLAQGAAIADVEATLVAAMNAVAETVKPRAGNPTGISAFFHTNFDIQLPENASPSIPDTYITDVVLA